MTSIKELVQRVRSKLGREEKEMIEGEPVLEWNGMPVELIVYEDMEKVPLMNAAIGGFFGGVALDGIFVSRIEEDIVIQDCRLALGKEVDEEEPQEFVNRILDERFGKGSSGSGTMVWIR